MVCTYAQIQWMGKCVSEIWQFEIFAKCVNYPWGRSSVVGRSVVNIRTSYTDLILMILYSSFATLEPVSRHQRTDRQWSRCRSSKRTKLQDLNSSSTDRLSLHKHHRCYHWLVPCNFYAFYYRNSIDKVCYHAPLPSWPVDCPCTFRSTGTLTKVSWNTIHTGG